MGQKTTTTSSIFEGVQILGSSCPKNLLPYLLAKITEYNIKSDFPSSRNKDKFIASMDVESLYPSLRSDDCAQIVRETIMDSDLSVEELNWKEMSIILRKNLSNEEIALCDLCELIPKKEKKPKKHMDVKDDEKCDDNLWTFPNDSPSNLDIKKLFAEKMSVVVKLVMNNHVYKFADKLRVQENEGGIGVTLTGILSELKMLLWEIKFKDKLNYFEN